MRRINIFTGHFGSGKTEIAINFARKLAKEGRKVVIVDLDIVNPYFCVRELKKELELEDIKVISSNPEYVNAELMVVPPEVLSIFNDKSYDVVIDVGGDDQGAIALGQYNRYFREEPYEMYFVVNTNRPFTGETQDIEEYMRDVQIASRLQITKLVNNTNLSYETTINDILEGHKEVEKISAKNNIPYEFTVCKKEFVEEVSGLIKKEIFPIDIFMMPPWRKHML